MVSADWYVSDPNIASRAARSASTAISVFFSDVVVILSSSKSVLSRRYSAFCCAVGIASIAVFIARTSPNMVFISSVVVSPSSSCVSPVSSSVILLIFAVMSDRSTAVGDG